MEVWKIMDISKYVLEGAAIGAPTECGEEQRNAVLGDGQGSMALRAGQEAWEEEMPASERR